MKKILFSMMALSIAAFTFTACEDVPEPYNNPYDSIKPAEPEVVIEPAGSGTAADPFNVAAIVENTASLADGDFYNNSEDVYVTGVVVEVKEISAQYGNATYYIADNAKAASRFYVYRGKMLEGASVTAETDLEVGDSVTVCGKIKNYKGTMEYDQGNYLVYLKKGNGETPTPDKPETKTVGSKDAPKTVAEALAAINAMADGATSEEFWYVKGKVVKVTTTAANFEQYKNLNYLISEDGADNNTITVYAGNGLDNAQFSSVDALKAGDEVIVYGQIQKYVNKSGAMTPEIAKGNYLVKYTAGTGGNDTPSGNGKGTADAPYSVSEAIAAGAGTGVYVKAFIVGSIDGKSTTDAKFNNQTSTASNILIAASASETDITKCMPVQLPTGAVRSALNLVDNTGNYKKEVTLYGNIEKYFSVTGLKSVTFAILDGKEIGTNPGGGSDTPDTPTDGIKAVTIAEFNAAAESTDVWYKLTGTIKNLKEGDQYGNFDLEDATGSVYVYGVLSEKGGAKKLFQELVTKYNLKDGVTITIIGTRGSYNGKIEVMNAYFVSVGGDNSGNNGGGEASTGADGSKIVSIADFNAAAESTDVWYQLTGTVKNLKDGDLYGNFDLEDETGSVYVYGVLSEKGGEKKKFQELVTAKGIANGKKITIVGNRGSYKEKIEVLNAYFISIE